MLSLRAFIATVCERVAAQSDQVVLVDFDAVMVER